MRKKSRAGCAEHQHMVNRAGSELSSGANRVN